LALACDVLVAGESAKFHSAFLKIGLSGTELGVSWRLQRAIGTANAREILLTGRPVDAQDAYRMGLVSRVVPDAQLDDLGMTLAKAMLEAQPDALRLTKRAMDAALEIGNFTTAMESEERGQMLMINRRRS
jgi:enoyl-CoA hydratase